MDVPAAPSPSPPHTHLAGWAHLLPAPPKSSPLHTQGTGPPAAVLGYQAESAPLHTPSTLQSTVKPSPQIPLPRKACPSTLLYQKGEMCGLKRCPSWITQFFQNHTRDACCGEDLVQGQDPYLSYTKSSNMELSRPAPVLLETLDHKLPSHFLETF